MTNKFKIWDEVNARPCKHWEQEDDCTLKTVVVERFSENVYYFFSWDIEYLFYWAVEKK